MIDHAIVLLAKKGLQGASFSEVLEASDAPRGSVYHHFPGGKDELVLAALATAGARALAFLDTLEGKSATEVAKAFIGLWRRVLVGANFKAGCSAVAVTVAADSPVLLEGAGDVFRAWRVRLSTLLAKGGVPASRAPSIAAMMIGTCEGAVALARAERSIEVFDLATAELQTAIKSAIRPR